MEKYSIGSKKQVILPHIIELVYLYFDFPKEPFLTHR